MAHVNISVGINDPNSICPTESLSTAILHSRLRRAISQETVRLRDGVNRQVKWELAL
jgi:hypothetical protein